MTHQQIIKNIMNGGKWMEEDTVKRIAPQIKRVPCIQKGGEESRLSRSDS